MNCRDRNADPKVCAIRTMPQTQLLQVPRDSRWTMKYRRWPWKAISQGRDPPAVLGVAGGGGRDGTHDSSLEMFSACHWHVSRQGKPDGAASGYVTATPEENPLARILLAAFQLFCDCPRFPLGGYYSSLSFEQILNARACVCHTSTCALLIPPVTLSPNSSSPTPEQAGWHSPYGLTGSSTHGD